MYFRLDQLGKNILRDFFVLVGVAETEVEVPAGDAQRIDVWHVPDPELLRAHSEIEPGLLRSMAAEQGMVEVFSSAPTSGKFHACMRKRYQWHHTLELRAERELPLLSACIISAGRPDGVLRDFGFVQDAGGPGGLYGTSAAPGWLVQIVVVAELPRVRGTLLLRLLGSGPVRRAALRDLAALPEDAWERRLALPWLVRLSFEVPPELLPGLPAEERDFIMETREWYEQWTKQRREQELRQLELERKQLELERKQLDREMKQAEEQALQRGLEAGLERGQLQMTAQLCGIRLGRSLTEAEHAALVERLDRLGKKQVGEVVLSFSPEALVAWLTDPNAR